jgi:hypothetical protein
MLNNISLNPYTITRSLGLIAFILVVSSVGMTIVKTWYKHTYQPVLLFYLDAEQNIPTFFSSCLLLFAAVLLLIITVLERKILSPHIVYWKTLSLGFLLMATDESVSLHEKLIILMVPIRNLLGNENLGIIYFSWIIPAIPIIVVLMLLLWKFLFQLPGKTRRTFLMAGIIYLSGCVGFEIIGMYYIDLYGSQDFKYCAISTIEESLEMTGIIVLISGLLTYIADRYKEIRFEFDKFK